MTNGASQGLFVIVAVVIFGIFVLISYVLFRDTLKPNLANIFTDGLEQATDSLKGSTDLEGGEGSTDLEDVLLTKYNASNFEEDHTEECGLDTFCEGFYKLIYYTASEKALEAYMLDYGVWNYFGTDYDNNIITSNSLEVFLEDGSVITASGNKLYREINGSKKLFFDMDNYHNHSYTEGAYTVNNKGVIIETTLDSNIKTLTIPDKISGKVVKGIDSGVFSEYNFTSVSLPDSIEIIGYEQFYNSTFTEFKKPKNLKYTVDNMFNPEVNVTIN